jgi:hypothetical protein
VFPNRRILGIAIWLSGGCAPHPGQSTNPPPRPARAVPSSTSAALVAPAPPPSSGFVRVLDDDCGDHVLLGDLGARTLLISPNVARFFEPGQTLAQSTDASQGLPSARTQPWLFAQRPIIIGVRIVHRWGWFLHSEPGHFFFRFAGGSWIPLEKSFGERPIALPVDAGTVVVGRVRDGHHGDSELAPTGNTTRAWLIDLDGAVTDLAAWPAAMTWQQRSSAHTLWAIATKPRQRGAFLLRIPVQGAAKFFPIPGAAGCRGREGFGLAMLRSVTDESAELGVSPEPCIAKGKSGEYSFENGQFRRVGEYEWPNFDPGFVPVPDVVEGHGATFNLQNDSVLVVRGDTAVRERLPSIAAEGEWVHRWLSVTAGGREVWVNTSTGGRCYVDRYVPPGVP